MNARSFHWERIHVAEMDCSEEFTLIQKRLSAQPGVESLRADYLERVVQIRYDSAQTDPAQLRSEIEALGFHARSAETTTVEVESFSRGWKDWSVAAGAICLAAAGVCYFFPPPAPMSVLPRIFAGFLPTRLSEFIGAAGWSGTLAIAATLLAGAPVATAAARSMRGRRIDMNVLMVVAAIGALLIGERFEAATAMCLFGFAIWLEDRSFRRARVAVRSLVELVPEVAHRFRALPGQSPEFDPQLMDDVHPDQLEVGEVFLVRPGERIPVDGTILDGESAVVEAHITGESLPVEKEVGSAVFAGAQNGDASLTVRATATTKESATSKLASLVAQSRLRQSPTERFVDRFAHWYTPVVIIIAAVIGLVVPLSLMSTGEPHFKEWLHRGLVLLVIACPCALVVSTPITLVCGLHRATRLGMLIKGGDYLEKMAALVGVAMDKTGTITTGSFDVVDVQSLADEPFSADELLSCAAALEVHSEHPLAQAIVAAARDCDIPIESAGEVEFHRGLGVTGRWRSHDVTMGNLRLMNERHADVSAATTHLDPEHVASGLVYLAIDSRVVGSIMLADTPRDDAEHCVREFHATGLHVTILTGDRKSVAEAIAKRVGIQDVRADLLPADKIDELTQLQKRGPIGMVGDGLNDAPALIQADVGIAMGRGASDLALDSADVVVLSPNLSRIPQGVALARATRRTLWQNIILAIGIKAIVLFVTALGYGSMWLAVAADVGASLIVVANGMRLLRFDPPVCCEAHRSDDAKFVATREPDRMHVGS